MTNRRWPTTREGFTDCAILDPLTSFCPRCHSYDYCWRKFTEKVGIAKAVEMRKEREQYRASLCVDKKGACLDG